MRNRLFTLFFAATLIFFPSAGKSQVSSTEKEQFINGDALPDAPELAQRGTYKVGVRTFTFVNRHQPDVLHSKNGVDPFYDRTLKVEVWYPAVIPAGSKEFCSYPQTMGIFKDSSRPLIPFTFNGRALRDAGADRSGAAYPLLIVSHGYPGSRLIFTYLTENLASKGYVVVSIDHMESTFSDKAGFASTLANRAKDILFVLNQVAASAKTGSGHFLEKLTDADHTALIGYSMGGYGVLNVAGAGYSPALENFFGTLTGGSNAVHSRTAEDKDYVSTIDPRIKAVVAFAPWGMKNGVWNAHGLEGLKTPVFFIAGSQDDVSGYDSGIRAIYQLSVNAPRYMLTYENARHNVAPNPPAPETLAAGVAPGEYAFYAEYAWKERRINNINQHFITAFLGVLMKQQNYQKYLDLPPKSNEKPWAGFKPRTSVGLEWLHAEKQ